MKIKQTSNEQLTAELYTDITAAYKTCGYNLPQAKDLVDIINDTAAKFRKYFGNNTLQDISNVFEHGALGDYGENTGLSVARFYQWMRSFNGNATNQQQADDEEPQQQEHPRDRVKDGHNMVNSAYESYCKNGYQIIPASVLLRWIVGDNLIADYDKRLADAKQEAAERLHGNYYQKRERFQKIGDYIKKNQDTEAESILLNHYFDECKAKKITKIYEE
jgi:hypothetical protein